MAQILLVEDTLELAIQISDVLKMEGHRVHISPNGTDALDMLHTEKIKPDVIVTDLLMPGLDGFGFIEQLKNDDALCKIPVVIMSAKSDKGTVSRASSLGITNFIAKPCHPETLLQSIGSLLA